MSDVRIANVLIVDDEYDLLVALQRMVSRFNYNTYTAGDVEQALEILDKTAIDIVITDIMLPKLSGVELLKTLKANSPDIHVIMITGEPTVETAIEAVQQGAFDYIAKPFTLDRISSTIAQAVNLKFVNDDRRRLAEDNERYQSQLERLVELKSRELYVSERRLRRLFDNSPEAILVTDPNGVIINFNAAALSLYGVRDDDIYHKHITDRLTPESKDKFASSLVRLINKHPIEIELAIIRNKQATIPIVRKGIPITNESSEISEILFYDRDITQTKIITQVAREFERGFKFLFQHSQYPIVLHAPDGSIYDTNNPCQDWFETATETEIPSILTLFDKNAAKQFKAILATLHEYPTGEMDAVLNHPQNGKINTSIHSTVLNNNQPTHILTLLVPK